MSAAVRLPHPAAARRALLTLLFLAGFLALAFVLGGSAQAASGTADHGRTSASTTAGAPGSGKQDGSAAADGSRTGRSGAAKAGLAGADEAGLAPQQRGVAQRAAARAASHVAGPVAEGAGRVEAAGEATRPVGEAVEDVASGGLNELPDRLGLGGLGDGIGGGGPDGGSGERPGGDGSDGASGAAGGDSSGDRAGGPRTDGGSGYALAAPLPGSAATATAGDGLAGSEGDPSGRSPLHRTPAVPAPGTSQHAGDGQSQRGGPHQLDAVLTGAGQPGPLQSGAARAADGTPTRDRAGDVLEFPG